MIAVSYIMKRKIKKIFYEIISNSKIFNIIFFNEMINDQDFAKLTGGTRQRGGLDNVEYGIKIIISCFEKSEEDKKDESWTMTDILEFKWKLLFYDIVKIFVEAVLDKWRQLMSVMSQSGGKN